MDPDQHASAAMIELPEGASIAGKYRIERVLGEGGMGRVYLAEQSTLGSKVCIKTLHVGAQADPQFRARFEREAKATSALRHPHIVHVFDFGTHVDGTLYLVMEYVKGRSLTDVILDVQVLGAHRTVGIFGQVCDALSLAHQNNVVHRDLKPGNLMLLDLPDEADFVKVLDFGSALLMQGSAEGERLTRAGMLIGTPAYMAPEYILGHGADERLDVYQVGVLLYLCMTGTLPFRGTAQQIFAQQVSVAPEPPRRRNPHAGISVPLERVILRALVKDPVHRYPSAKALKQALDNAFEGVADEYQYALGTGGIEVAKEERPVVLCSIAVLDSDALRSIKTVGKRHGALLNHTAAASGQEQEHRFTLIFGIDRDIPEAAADSMRCALELIDMAAGLSIGIRDARASCEGRASSPGFRFQLFGEGQGVLSALTSHAKREQILISGPVARYVPPDLRLAPVQPPTSIDEPTFALSDPLLPPVAMGSRLEFAGRQDELRRLLEFAASATEHHVVVLRGPAGIGKTRLLEEMISQAARIGVLWCVLPSCAKREVGPAHPVSLLAALGWSHSEGAPSMTERSIVDVLLGRLSQQEAGFGGDRRQARLLAAALEGLSRRGKQEPTVVVLDQLEVADDLTLALAARLMDMSEELGISVVLSMRSGAELPLVLPEGVQLIELTPLKTRELVSLAKGVLPDLTRDTAKIVVRASRGVPLLVEEVLAALGCDALELLEEAAELRIEEAVALLVGHRLKRCSQDVSSGLQAAAVLGESPRDVEILDLISSSSNESLTELQNTGLMVWSPSGRLQFRSTIVRRAVLSTLAESDLRALHARAAHMLQRRYRDTPAYLGEVGEHLLAAGDVGHAFAKLRQAASYFHLEGALRASEYFHRAALRAAQTLGDRYEVETARVARDLGQLLIDVGRYSEAERLFEYAFSPAKEAQKLDLSADLLRLHGRARMLQSDYDTAREELEASLSFSRRRGLRLNAAKVHGDLAELADGEGKPEEAHQQLSDALELIDGMDGRDFLALRIQLYNRLGRIKLQEQKMVEAIAIFAQALSISEHIGDRFQSSGLLGNLGGAYAHTGDHERAIHFTERALRESEALGDQMGIARQSFNLALLWLSVGQPERARTLLQNGYDASRRAGWREGLAMNTAALAKMQ